MAQSKKTAGATKPAAKKAPASKPAATTPTPAPADQPAPAATPASAAPAGVTTLEDVNGARLPESGPSDDSTAVRLVSPKGTKVTVEERTAAALRTQGYKNA